MRNSSIPDHLAEFYQKAYEALYSVHDRNDKGYYLRDFRCKLDEEQFRKLFARFCFQTYFQECYDFSENDILKEIRKSIIKLGLLDVEAKDFLFDLQKSVCLIIEDGQRYRFVHRTFQNYFCAYYTAKELSDIDQKCLFQSILYNQNPTTEHTHYFEILCQIEPKRFAINALEIGLRHMQEKARLSDDPDEIFLSAYRGDDLRGYILIHLFLQFLRHQKPALYMNMQVENGYNLPIVVRLASRVWLEELSSERKVKTTKSFIESL